MRGVWIDEGTPPAWEKLDSFSHVGFSYRDPETPDGIAATYARHKQPCIYVGHGWLTGSPATVAKVISEAWIVLGGKTRNLPVQVDFEQHDPEWLAEFFTAWRMRRPWLATSWALEGFQGGGHWGSWLSPIRQTIIDARVLLVPCAYDGEMTPFDPRGVVLDLVEAGFPADRIVPFHDAARLYRGWDGWAFTARRLP